MSDPRPSASFGLFPELEAAERARAAAAEREAEQAKRDAEQAKREAVALAREGPFAAVALDRPLRCEFTYRVPKELAAGLAVGMRVAVPFGRRREVGVVVGLSDETEVDPKRMRAIAAQLDEDPLVDAELLELTKWMAGYYACSWGEALAAILPASLKRERGTRKRLVIRAREGVGAVELAELEERFPKQHRLLRTLMDVGGEVELRDLVRRLNLSEAPARTLERRGWVQIEKVEAAPDPLLGPAAVRERPAQLSPEQELAVERIGGRVEDRTYGTFLLQGVTGSGKTEVYLRVIERALACGRGAIVLVPEIALTPQTVSWFRSRFGDVALMHSRMSDAQRADMWRRVRSGELRVAVGARSAIFAPIRDLGVIVVDEEHEPSFKQGSTPRYHARDVAVYRANAVGAACVLGSATPSLESWQNAREGRYERLMLQSRVGGGRMPDVEVVDMGSEVTGEKGPRIFSRRLKFLLEDAIGRGEQGILFLNRRGFAPVLWCPACGETVRCANCDVTLTFHRKISRAVCHSCCEECVPPRACPSCTAPGLRYLGSGSERVQSALAEALPAARIARMDSDTMHRREDYEETLEAFGKGELDVLVGTQMIAKGLDFPNVTVVGIVSADSALYLPDFRAAERTFQLLAQVSGRAGRGALEGRILVQTMTPQHAAITHAARHDVEGFLALESTARRELGYPPYGRLLRVVFEDDDESRVHAVSQECGDLLRAHAASPTISILGPAAPPMERLRGRHRRHLLVKSGTSARELSTARGLLIEFAERHARPRITIDVDPVSML